MGFSFLVLERKACINDQWRKGESQTGHVHVISLQNRLRFSLSDFIFEVLYDYGIAPSQLASNSQRILNAFYIRCDIIGITPTSRLVRRFYFLKSRKEFYFLQSRNKSIITNLLENNKGWKLLFIRIIDPSGFEVNLQWQVAKASGIRRRISYRQNKRYKKKWMSMSSLGRQYWTRRSQRNISQTLSFLLSILSYCSDRPQVPDQ